MVVSNLILRGELKSLCSLEDLIPFGTHFYDHRPRMIKFTRHGITLLVFTSLRFRLMGKGEHHKSVLAEFLNSIPWKIEAKNLKLSTMTLTHGIPYQINLHKLYRQPFSLDSEQFPAARWIHEGRENFNVFHSGCIVITGVTDINKTEAHAIPTLLSQLKNACYS